MNFPLRAAVLSAIVFATPVAAQARSTAANPFSFSIAAGASIPTGDLGDFSDVGYNLTVGLGTHMVGSPLGFRAEGSPSRDRNLLRRRQALDVWKL